MRLFSQLLKPVLYLEWLWQFFLSNTSCVACMLDLPWLPYTIIIELFHYILCHSRYSSMSDDLSLVMSMFIV